MKSPSGFLFKNHWKTETMLAYYYAARFRLQLKLLHTGKLRKNWGRENAESAPEEPVESYRQAARISRIVNKVCDKTPWESKCLVRALTARRLLEKRGISSTLYLGCGMEAGEMVAHAWLRCGELYVTGGDGKKYTTVAKFCTEPENRNRKIMNSEVAKSKAGKQDTERRVKCLPSGES